jgi:hypothetical protein
MQPLARSSLEDRTHNGCGFNPGVDSMNTYILLLHERPADAAETTPAQMAEIVQRYKAWAGEMAAAGRLAGGEKLTDDGGRQLRLRGGQVVASDGPYAEAQDVVGGYFVLKAASDAEAESLAMTCPHLQGTQWIEIRRIEVV